MNVAGRLIPIASVVVLVLIAVLPWGLPPAGRFVLPLLPFAAIHYWVSRHAGRLPEWVAFAAGLTVDVLSNGPLGYWSLIYLIGHMLAGEGAHWARESRLERWAIYAVSVFLLVAAAWAIASVYYLEIADWQPFAWAAMLSALSYPIFAAFLRALDPDPLRRPNRSFERGV
jgi:rod shape-determining protein MreD